MRAAERYATVSLQSLALWRVFLGAATVYSVLRRWPHAGLLYSEEGFYTVAGQGGPSWALGPLAWVDGGVAVHVVFALVLLVSLAFLVGFGMRVVRYLLLPALWVLEARATLAASGAEVVLHLQALYAMALPLAEVGSVDAWLAKRRVSADDGKARPTSVCSAFYPLLLVQLATIYAFGCICKTGEPWQDGSAAARALHLVTFVSPLGASLADAPPRLLAFFSYATLVVEGLLPFLLLSPWARRKLHALAAVLIITLHGGIALTMDIGVWGTAMGCFLPLLWHPKSASPGRLILRTPRRHVLELFAALTLVYLGAARVTRDVFLLALPALPLPAAVMTVTSSLHLSQPWMMFSPDPGTSDRMLIVDAVTASGRHFDPFRRAVLGPEDVLTHVPLPTLSSSVFGHYETEVVRGVAARQHELSRWVFAQRPWTAPSPSPSAPAPNADTTLRALTADDPVVRIDAWAFVVATRPGTLVPEERLDSLVGVLALPLQGALPLRIAQARGVWAPERALDGKLVPDGTHVFTPVSAAMSAGCPELTLDLGAPRSLVTALVQADAADQFLLEGSPDGRVYTPLGELTRSPAKHHLTRLVPLAPTPVRYVRVRPKRPGTMRHYLSEIALFDRAVTLPPLPKTTPPPDGFYSSLTRPAVGGVFSVQAKADPSCPAEAGPRPAAAPPATKER